MCGEQTGTRFSSRVNLGSPPRVRGTENAAIEAATQHRITPACAGNRLNAGINQLKSKDHPRVCGEQNASLIVASWCRGSPPRVRGTAAGGFLVAGRFGITPACAGNRSGLYWIDAILEDHPRVCGEQSASQAIQVAAVGSPPRVRGTEHRRIQAGGIGRITPACAGNSLHQLPVLAQQ